MAARITRAERLAQINALLADGLTHQQIAGRLGMARSSVRCILGDPDAARRARYQGRCETCGAATSGCNGAADAPTACARCANRARRGWTREAVIDAIQRFVRAHGRPPGAREWVRSDPVNGYPAKTSVYRSAPCSAGNPFATWAEAIHAAGFECNPTGRPPGGRKVRFKSPGRAGA